MKKKKKTPSTRPTVLSVTDAANKMFTSIEVRLGRLELNIGVLEDIVTRMDSNLNNFIGQQQQNPTGKETNERLELLEAGFVAHNTASGQCFDSLTQILSRIKEDICDIGNEDKDPREAVSCFNCRWNLNKGPYCFPRVNELTGQRSKLCKNMNDNGDCHHYKRKWWKFWVGK